MAVSAVTSGVLTTRAKPRSYCIRLMVSPAGHDDAWDMSEIAFYYGGVAANDYCFVFPNEEAWLTALEVLRRQFGPEYCEAVDSETGQVANSAGQPSGSQSVCGMERQPWARSIPGSSEPKSTRLPR